MKYYKQRNGRSLVELLTVWTAILIIAGSLISHANIVLVRAKEEALKNELKNLRLTINLYYILNKRYPDRIEGLVDIGYDIHSGRKAAALKGTFLKDLKFDANGKIKDPFGNIYLYNSHKGVIKSKSKGYEDW